MSGRPILSNEEIEGTPGTPRKLMSQKKSKVTVEMTAMVKGREIFRKKGMQHV